MSVAVVDSLDAKYTSFSATELEPSTFQLVQREIRESLESRTKCLEILQRKLRDLKDVDPCLEEEFLLRFLRVAKFDVEKALDRMKKFYEKREIQLKAFKDCALTCATVHQFPYLNASPYRMADNSVLVISQFGILDVYKITFEKKFYLELLAYTHLIANPVTQMCGVTIITDFMGFNLRFLRHYPPTKFKFVLDTFQSSFPLRIKALHVVNTPQIFNTAYNIVYPFLSKKLQSRLFIHPKNDNWKSLHTSIPSEILPEEYGGKLKKYELINMLKNVETLDEDFRKELKFGYIKSRHQREKFKIIVDEPK